MDEELKRKNRVAEWVFDTLPLLKRFHLWLDDVKDETIKGEVPYDDFSFTSNQLEKAFLMTAAITALGARIFGRYGEAKGSTDKAHINQVKKDADAISAYAMSECLWYLTRNLPENHALLVSLGEGLMPKVGETHEMGSNPLLGFGRIYARPQVAQYLEPLVHRLINEEGFTFRRFQKKVEQRGITIWGSAIDTLENTSRFAKGADTGPMTVLHLFDQPLVMTRPYEGYAGGLFVPEKVARTAHEESILLAFNSPRRIVMEMLQKTYPGLKPENTHVWTLQGKSRTRRLGEIWKQWEDLGAHLVDDNWETPYGIKAFTSSGTYAPTYMIGSWEKDGEPHVFICDGYAASAEALQAASLSTICDVHTSLSLFSDKFELPCAKERLVMLLDPKDPEFTAKLAEIAEGHFVVDEKVADKYREMIYEAANAGVPWPRLSFNANDFFPNKYWRGMALTGNMCPDPYNGTPGVKDLGNQTYEVTTQLATEKGIRRVTLKMHLQDSMEVSRLIFNPLLDRFVGGEDHEGRPVKKSDSGRIRNELQTLCPQALESYGTRDIKVHFNRINEGVMSKEKQAKIRKVLAWFKRSHPVWFSWLELAD